ncbi:MAG TPA: prolipoprotein diacylglyceryl transferase [Candidatus Limiplasma sp.]|nr:prolipoprotein diacylglyceryl transferase [Candidatus Limiplasma sp.]HRX09650.1 prolipoprotein diacylglyceryl transferase [Candidatus Limiplasma sp.]
MDDFMDAAEGFHIPVVFYWALLAVLLAVFSVFASHDFKRRQMRTGTVIGYLLAALPLSFFFGRLIYAAVRYDWLFFDSMGSFSGFLPFFDPSKGGINATGILLGCLLAGMITAYTTRQPAGKILDGIVPYGVLLFALIRFAEPITGQGYGGWIENPLLPFYPFGIMNDWGEWQLPVCAMEGLLALLVSGALFSLRSQTKKAGTLTLYALALLSASQIIPQSLRQDGVLMIFIFAKVNQIGYMVFLCGPLLYAGTAALRRGAAKKAILTEWTLMIAGVLLAIGCEYALDKINLPDLLIYAVMALAIAGMGALAVHRIHREDIA